MADESPHERERRLIREGEGRARDEARIEAHLARHDEQFRVLNETQSRAGKERAAIKQQVLDLTNAFNRSLTIAETRAEDAEKAAKAQVTSRQLYIAAVGMTTAIIGTLAAAGVI